MRCLLIAALSILVGCSSQPQQTDFFAGQSEFAARREVETLVLGRMSYEAACAQVTAVLMDLDCNLQEINSELGVFSATSSSRWIPAAGKEEPGYVWQACAGHRVTVTVTERPAGDLAVRATFDPPAPAADQAFQTLLRKSILFEAGKEQDHE